MQRSLPAAPPDPHPGATHCPELRTRNVSAENSIVRRMLSYGNCCS
jgi:hypothetical protein